MSEDMTFTSFTSPIKRISGRAGYLAATTRFYSMITSLKVKDVLVDGQRACALTHYEFQPPAGPACTSDVAEAFSVQDGTITSFDIYFDSAPFPKECQSVERQTKVHRGRGVRHCVQSS